jgi:hypothetical protein
MLMAYEDRGKFKIEDIPAGPTRVPTHPIESHSKALEILEWAESERDDVQWNIEGKGPYRVCE